MLLKSFCYSQPRFKVPAKGAGDCETTKEINEDELDNLNLIANECGLYGGPAVFEARGILGIDIKDSCIEESERMASLAPNHFKKITSDCFFSLKPNPAHNIIHLTYNRVTLFTVTDITGRRINEYFLPGDKNSMDINIGEIPNGLYIYSFKSSEGNTKTGKFVKE